MNIEKSVKELSHVCTEMFRATGCMFEQERLRLISMITAVGSGGTGGGSSKYPRSIMENRVIKNVRAVSEDNPLFMQWRQKFTRALGQDGGTYEEIVCRLDKEIDLGREMEKAVTGLTREYGDQFDRVWRCSEHFDRQGGDGGLRQDQDGARESKE